MHHRLLASRWPLLWGVILAWGWTAAPRAWSADPVRVEYNTDKAVALVKRTGRPLLAIGGTTNCPYCVRMARQLETNEALAPLAAKYVILKIDTSTPLWQEWTRRYEVEGDGVPQVIILRGDGQQIYGKAGAPVELDRFLEKYLADAGTVLTDRELADLEKLVKEAQKNLKKRDYPKAIELAQECLREECHAEAVGEARKVLDQVAELHMTVRGQQEGLPRLRQKIDKFRVVTRRDGGEPRVGRRHKGGERRLQQLTQRRPVVR